MNPRQGPLARIHRYREASWDTDPAGATNEYLIPLMTDGFALRQPRAPGVFYDGVSSSKGSYSELIDCAGEITTSLDYDYVGWDLMDVLGSVGYTRVGSFHRWVSLSNPLPHGIRKEFTQTTAIIHRYPGVIAHILRLAQASRGQQQYGVTRLGKGREETTDIATPTLLDTTTKAANSYSNTSLTHDAVILANTAVFDLMIDRRVTPKEGIATQGQLAAYSIGVSRVEGNLGKIFTTEDGDTFYLLAKNETPSKISCIYGNKPFSAGPTKFLRVWMDRVLFDRSAPAAGGDTIPDQTQHWFAELPLSGVYHRAGSFGTILGPYTLSGSNNVFSSKPEGGATVDVTLTTGSRTAAQIAAELNAAGPFNAKFIAYDLNGRLEYASLNVALSSSVQWQTATANSAHTVLGFDSTTWNGYAPSEVYVELFNGISTDFS